MVIQKGLKEINRSNSRRHMELININYTVFTSIISKQLAMPSAIFLLPKPPPRLPQFISLLVDLRSYCSFAALLEHLVSVYESYSVQV
jgi:hypothetical protein